MVLFGIIMYNMLCLFNVFVTTRIFSTNNNDYSQQSTKYHENHQQKFRVTSLKINVEITQLKINPKLTLSPSSCIKNSSSVQNAKK